MITGIHTRLALLCAVSPRRKLGLGGCTVVALALAGIPPSHADTIEGIWSAPVTAGTSVNPLNNQLTFHNNASSAVVSIFNAPGGSTINSGTFGNTYGVTSPLGQPDISGCAFLAASGIPCQSTISFVGNTIPADPSTPFAVGTIAYTNGSSNPESLIFGATLTFIDAQTGAVLGTDIVSFNYTSDIGTAVQNADYITFSGLFGVSFNVAEGDTALATAYGFIDDLVLTGLTVAGGEGGSIGSDPPLPATAPEPASLALMGLGLAGLSIVRRSR
jgi:hypothetical protein